jgi:hypothetical protein
VAKIAKKLRRDSSATFWRAFCVHLLKTPLAKEIVNESFSLRTGVRAENRRDGTAIKQRKAD